MKSGNYLRGQPSSDHADDVFARFWKTQSVAARSSYALGAIGILLAIHDYHHPKDSFGYSTLVLGAAILVYLFSLGRRR